MFSPKVGDRIKWVEDDVDGFEDIVIRVTGDVMNCLETGLWGITDQFKVIEEQSQND